MTKEEWFNLKPGDIIYLARTGGRDKDDGTKSTILNCSTSYYNRILNETNQRVATQHGSKGWALEAVGKDTFKSLHAYPGWAYEYWLYDIIWQPKPEEYKSRIGNIE